MGGAADMGSTMPDATAGPTPGDRDGGFDDPTGLEARVGAVMEAAWVDLGEQGGRPRGYTAPNTRVYPWAWSWDSCFHVLVWARLGRVDRSLAELREVFVHQAPDGFVPHMGYQLDPGRSVGFWGRRGCSSITQPPIYAHVVAELGRRGIEVPGELVEAATAGVRFLIRHRERDPGGLVRVVHPWETGCDDSPRWDDLCPGGFSPERWREVKGELVAGVVTSPWGSPVAGPGFPVAPAGFNAMVAHGAEELAAVTGDEGLAAAAAELVEALDARFDPDLATWCDAGPTAGGSGRVRTADALCGLLVSRDAGARAAAAAQLVDTAAHGGPFGPAGVHRGEPSFSPSTYWRGPVWPQLAYLLWVGLGSGAGGVSGGVDGDGVATMVARSTVRGALRSGLAEYWDPDTGVGSGAVPQSWTGLALVLADAGGAGTGEGADR